MHVEIDNKDFLKSLDEYEILLINAFKQSTAHLITGVAKSLTEITPVGDDTDAIMQSYYLERYDDYGWAPFAGMLMANWYFELNAVDGLFDDAARDTSGETVIYHANEVMQHFQLGDSILVTNETPYADAIENGSSRQAPYGMSRPLEDAIPEIYKISFKEFLNV